MTMNRRSCLGLAASALIAPWASAETSAESAKGERDASMLADWQAWKTAFLAPDGRVVDHLQRNASHSEGQGYGMVLAVTFDDAEAFRRIHSWTERFLAVRQDPLLAWRWKPDQTPHISDYNNATDGDLFYAWALLSAARRFGEDAYGVQSKQIARFLAASCVRRDPRGGGRLLLLPGADGFVDGDRITVNPSYYMPLALRDLGLAADAPELLQCSADGEALIAEIANAGPVPDWIDVEPHGWHASAGHTFQSGYDALRIALFLIWSGRSHHPAVRRAAAMYAASETSIPILTDHSGKTVTVTSDLAGYNALASLVRCADGAWQNPAPSSHLTEQPYYPATLQLFCNIAARTSGLVCEQT